MSVISIRCTYTCYFYTQNATCKLNSENLYSGDTVSLYFLVLDEQVSYIIENGRTVKRI